MRGFRFRVSGVSGAAGGGAASLIKKRKFRNVGSASAPTQNGWHGGPPYISSRNEFLYEVSGLICGKFLNLVWCIHVTEASYSIELATTRKRVNLGE